jgi:hypothetical protein
MALKGKRASQYIDDDTTWDQLYEDGVDFQTIYDVSESQVQNKLRRPEQLKVADTIRIGDSEYRYQE